MKNLLPLFAVVLFSIQSVFAEPKKTPGVEEALRLTQEMLKDPEGRRAEINKSAEGKAVDAKVKEVAGSEKNEQAIYELAASVFASLTEQAAGDPVKMQKMLDDARANPEAFASKWSPDQVKKLEQISKEAGKSENSEKPEKKIGPSKVTTRPIK